MRCLEAFLRHPRFDLCADVRSFPSLMRSALRAF
jgi:hypothetical protein